MAAPPATPLPGARAAQGHQNIAQAYLADPTGRYAHFVLGADYEAAGLVVVHVAAGVWHGLVLRDGVLSRMLPFLSEEIGVAYVAGRRVGPRLGPGVRLCGTERASLDRGRRRSLRQRLDQRTITLIETPAAAGAGGLIALAGEG
eukprot:gene3604-4490_t